MSDATSTPNRPTSREWRAAWAQLSPLRRRLHLLAWAMLLLFAIGALALLVAMVHTLSDLPLAAKLALDAWFLGVVAWRAGREPLMPEDPSDPGPSPTFAHGLASVLSLTILPWVATAGLLGADLSTRPDFYAQIAQIIPVLLLAVLVERRFFAEATAPTEEDRGLLRAGFVLLVAGPGLAEVLALLAIASHVRWIEVGATLLAASTIPALLVLIAGPVLMALYAEPAPV
jgi:hypothetical protein